MDTAGKTRLQAPFWKQYLPSMVPGVNLTAIMQSYTEKTKVCRYCSEIYPMKEKPCGELGLLFLPQPAGKAETGRAGYGFECFFGCPTPLDAADVFLATSVMQGTT